MLCEVLVIASQKKKKDIEELEKVQRRAPKVVKRMEQLPYKEMLWHLVLLV